MTQDIKRPSRATRRDCVRCGKGFCGTAYCCHRCRPSPSKALRSRPTPCRACGAPVPPVRGGRARAAVLCEGCRPQARCGGCGAPQPRGGLCLACYQAAGAAEVILPTRPATPTAARPGTPEKVEELARRYGAGEELWSEKDGR